MICVIATASNSSGSRSLSSNSRMLFLNPAALSVGAALIQRLSLRDSHGLIDVDGLDDLV